MDVKNNPFVDTVLKSLQTILLFLFFFFLFFLHVKSD